MKKIYVILFVLLLGVSVVFIIFNCFKDKGLNYEEKAKTFLQNESISFDSLAVDRVDTLTEMKYARMTVELLEQMRDDYEGLQYAETDAHRRDILALQVNEIEDSLLVYIDRINTNTASTTNLVCYLVYAHYYLEKEEFPFTFFLTPDGEYYNYDPFHTEE